MTKSKLYTGGGDKGTTSLVGGERVSKYHPRLESYGSIDELSSFIGLLMSEEIKPEDREFLARIQHKLFNIGSYLATNQTSQKLLIESKVSPESISKLEREIDRIDSALPKAKAFILPSGCRSSSLAHVCRTVCRRCERNIYRMMEEAEVEDAVLIYMNRLSDYLFVLARQEVWRNTGGEVNWDASID